MTRTIIITGATASLRGKPFTPAFASAKAAQRSLAQSFARQLGPEGIHVALVIVDGVINAANAADFGLQWEGPPQQDRPVAHHAVPVS